MELCDNLVGLQSWRRVSQLEGCRGCVKSSDCKQVNGPPVFKAGGRPGGKMHMRLRGREGGARDELGEGARD